MQTNSYTAERVGLGKELPPDRSFTLFSWNICCVPGGYSITDGGVVPWKERIDAIVDKVLEKDGDVNCFYELFDFHAAQYLKERLKEAGYTHFFYNIGPMSVGVSSGFLIASKYKCENARFDPFSIETLPGRSRFANKGVFSFDLASSDAPFSRICALHLSHSELPEFPTEEEVSARARQMEFVFNHVPLPQDQSLIFTGDFNMDLSEYASSPWQARLIRAEGQEEPTWGGDAFCAALSEKRASGPLTLDYTAYWQGTAARIDTEVVQAGYFATQYRQNALSDHSGLFSRIQLLPVV
jgi:endonuclease/exonuclease/phosphatase family metal-dependent hydrolase